MEGFEPGARHLAAFHSGLAQRLAKLGELLFLGGVGDAGVVEGKMIVEGFLDEEGLANAPAAIHGAELRFVFLQKA